MYPQLMEAHDFDTQLDQHATAVARSNEDTPNSIKSPNPTDQDSVANQVREIFLTSPQIMPFTNKETTGYERHIQGLGTLRRLPGEIRVLIFTDVLVAGSMEMMRVSKAVNYEASPVLLTKGVCRLNVGFVGTMVASQYPEFDIVPELADRIQNVTFVINAAASTSRRSMRHEDCLRLFAESRVRRKCCRVVFKCTYFLANLPIREVLHTVRQYTRFERVIIKLAIDREQDLIDELVNWSCSELVFQFVDKQIEVFDLVKNMLSPSLGKSEQYVEDGNRVVTFYPRNHGTVHLQEENEDYVSTGHGVYLDVEANEEDVFERGAGEDAMEFYEACEDDYIQRYNGSSQD